MGLTPKYRIVANGSDITAVIAQRFVSLRYTDEAGVESDVLEIELADTIPDHPIQLPATGAELELYLGYEDAIDRIGLFVVDELELSGWPGTMTIRARAAPQTSSKAGKSALQTQKTRSWIARPLGEIVKSIAAEHKLEAAISSGLATITLPATLQTDESDIHFLTRIAKKYDAVAKAAGGRLVLAKRGESKAVSGASLPVVTVRPSDVSSYRVTIADRDAGGKVIACWHDVKTGTRHEVSAGDGEPVRRLKMQHQNEEQARAAAAAEIKRRGRGKSKLSLSMRGRVDLMAECRLVTSGFRSGVDGDWIVTRVEQSLTKSGGFVSSVDAEVAASN